MIELAAAFYQELREKVEKGTFPLTPVTVKDVIADNRQLQGTVMASIGWRPLARRRTQEEAYTLTMIAAHDRGIGLELHVDDPRAGAMQCVNQCDKYLITANSMRRFEHVGIPVAEIALSNVLCPTNIYDEAQTCLDLADGYANLAQGYPTRDVFMPGQYPDVQNEAIGMFQRHVINDPFISRALFHLSHPV